MREAFRRLLRRELTEQQADDIRPGLRRLVVGSHIIWFRSDSTTLRIIRVQHGRRDAGRRMD